MPSRNTVLPSYLPRRASSTGAGGVKIASLGSDTVGSGVVGTGWGAGGGVGGGGATEALDFALFSVSARFLEGFRAL